jgi:hypothetical protein
MEAHLGRASSRDFSKLPTPSSSNSSQP